MASRNKKKAHAKSGPTAHAAHAARRSQAVRPAKGTSSKRLRLLATLLVVIASLASGLYGYRWYQSSQIASLQQMCEQAAAERDWPTLELHARQWAALQPDNAQPWSMAAAAARAMGELTHCAEYLSQLPDSADVSAFHELGLLQMEVLNDPFAARATCLRTLRLHPHDSESSLRLLFIEAMLCNRQAVLEETRRSIAVASDALPTYAYLLSAFWLTFANGNTLNNLWAEIDSDSEVFEVASVVHLFASRQLPELAEQASDDIDEAPLPQEFYEKQVAALHEKYPSNLELLAVTLSNLCQTGDTAGVAQLLSSAPTASLQDGRFWRSKGWLHAASEEWDQAESAYRQALKLSAVDWATQNELAELLRRTQGVEAAREMQQAADTGKNLAVSILKAPNFAVIPNATYQLMADYFEQCGEQHTAQSLRRLLASSQSPESSDQ